MVEVFSWLPIAAVAVSLLAIPLIVLSRRRPNVREFWTLTAAALKWLIVLMLFAKYQGGTTCYTKLFELIPGVPLALKTDSLGLLFALISSTLWLATSFYSIGYVRRAPEKKQTRYFASFALCLSATIGIAFAANLLTFLIFYEILSIATYPLVIHKETPEAIRSGRKYLVYALTAGLCLTAAVIWTYQLNPQGNFIAGGFLGTPEATPGALLGLFGLFLIGCGVKAGLMPLHSWLPAAMVAPTPVSALLHAVAVVKAGVFGIMRITGFVFTKEALSTSGSLTLLMILSASTLLVASLFAIREEKLKRRLAYSTIAHLSYILLGIALFNELSWAGGLFHFLSHATLKITLFFCAGAIYIKTRRENIQDLNGMGRQMPFTFAAFTLASLGLIGIPGLNGFISKWALLDGSLAHSHYFLFGSYLLASLLCAAYLLPIPYRAFILKNPTQEAGSMTEASPWLLVPLLGTALLSLCLGLFPNSGGLFDLVITTAISLFKGVVL